jgi:uncharacterized protein
MNRLTAAGAFCALALLALTPALAGTKPDASVQATMTAARKGDAAAQLKLGDMYDLGEGVAQDFKEAVKWYRAAAEQGNAQAQFALAEMYKNGDGVAKDIPTALKWYRSAADKGNPGAQLLLGGTGVSTDNAEAARWYRLSANSGDARAQLLLANFYNTGQGVVRNAVAAYALYTVSFETMPANNPAMGHRAGLAKGMPAAEVESATALAREMARPGNLLKALDGYLKKAG